MYNRVMNMPEKAFSTAAVKLYKMWNFHTDLCTCIRLCGFFSRNIRLYAVPISKSITFENMSSAIKAMEYGVRGPIMSRAIELENELMQGVKKPFDKVIRGNLGDAHAMGQKPITFVRQVLALVTFPELLKDPRFPEDVKERAKTVLANCRGGSVGAYTDSPGIEIIRKHVAQFIEKRDGVPCDFENIIIFGGASPAIKVILQLMDENVNGKKPGVMIPIPQYPLYSASLAEYRMEQIDYYLDEEHGWALDPRELERALSEGKKKCNPRAIVVINPGNPTGQVLTKENIKHIIEFAQRNNLLIFADEVYQDNVYEKNKFYSFKKIMSELKPPFNEVEIASFMSSSKGYTGECGLRGGCVELLNMDPQVKAMLIKCISAMLCPTVLGQVTIYCTVNPPQPEEPSFKMFQAEKNAILQSLADRAGKITKTFNSVKNMSSNKVQGALYAFPRLYLPKKAVAKAKSLNQCPSEMYCFDLLEETGICVVPGAGFGQQPGTYHFRTTILPQPTDLEVMLEKFTKFHMKFLKKYS